MRMSAFLTIVIGLVVLAVPDAGRLPARPFLRKEGVRWGDRDGVWPLHPALPGLEWMQMSDSSRWRFLPLPLFGKVGRSLLRPPVT